MAQYSLNNASWINNAMNAWRVRLKSCILSVAKFILYPWYGKAIRKFDSTFLRSDAPAAKCASQWWY